MTNDIQLLETINKFQITAKLEFPYKSSVDNTDDFIGRFGNEIIEPSDIRFNQINEDDFRERLWLDTEQFHISVYSSISICRNKAEALGIYDGYISLITREARAINTFLNEVKQGIKQYKGVAFIDNGIEQNTHPDRIEHIERKIFDRIYLFIKDMILSNILNKLNKERERLSLTRLNDFKLTIESKLPIIVHPTFTKGAHSFVIKPSRNLKYKVGQLRDMFIYLNMIADDEQTSTGFINIFLNKPINNKIILSKECSKAFLNTLLSQFSHKGIITNKDYRKIASECFIFAADPAYDWAAKFRKTSALKSEDELNLVEECINMFI